MNSSLKRPLFVFSISLLLGATSLALSACSGGNTNTMHQQFDKQFEGGVYGTPAKPYDLRTRVSDLEKRVAIIEAELKRLNPSLSAEAQEQVTALTEEKDALTVLIERQTQKPMSAEVMSESQGEPLPRTRHDPHVNTMAIATSAPTSLKGKTTTAKATELAVKKTPVVEETIPTPPVTNATSTVKGIRVAAHSGNKTRVAMDFTPGDAINYDIQQNGSDVVLTMPKTTWSALKAWNSNKTPLIAKYAAMTDGDTSKLTLSTKGDDLTVRVFTLGPASVGGGPRLVIDFEGGA